MTARAPLFRLLCHCSICQQFNDSAFADVVVFRAAAVQQPDASKIRFDTYRPPPNVQRGKCTICERPAIEVFEAPLAPSLIMIPQPMFVDNAALPDPVAHIFYESRVDDINDALPKYSGYFRSQLAFGKFLIRGLWQG
ncbi:MAG: GFA family protein [Pseudomonadota bacterium]